jgi:hypothetical protein
MHLPCTGELNIPKGLLESERDRIEGLRQDYIERIQHRAIVWLQLRPTPKECEAMFEEQVLNSGMTYDEAYQVLHQMHWKNMDKQAANERKAKI